jgi:hypothetical protein
LPRKNHVQHQAILRLSHELVEHRHVGQLFVLLQAKLHDDLESTRRKIIPVSGACYAPGIADDAVEYAALDREHDFLRAWIAGDRLEPGAKERIERDGEGVLVAASAG